MRGSTRSRYTDIKVDRWTAWAAIRQLEEYLQKPDTTWNGDADGLAESIDVWTKMAMLKVLDPENKHTKEALRRFHEGEEPPNTAALRFSRGGGSKSQTLIISSAVSGWALLSTKPPAELAWTIRVKPFKDKAAASTVAAESDSASTAQPPTVTEREPRSIDLGDDSAEEEYGEFQ